MNFYSIYVFQNSRLVLFNVESRQKSTHKEINQAGFTGCHSMPPKWGTIFRTFWRKWNVNKLNCSLYKGKR